MKIQDKFGEMAASFSGVNWNNPGTWPLVVKLSFYALAMAVVLFGVYVAFITDLNSQLEVEQNKQVSLLKDFEEKSFKAMNKDAYKQQLADMEEAFSALLRQLPKETEVPSLLEDITHTGLGSGLEFSQISLGTESRKEFYAELPIQIKVGGDYHGFGAFVSGVASLPRIVTLHDFTITNRKRAAAKGKGTSSAGVLDMSITAKTYRYSDASQAPSKGKRKGGKTKAKGKK